MKRFLYILLLVLVACSSPEERLKNKSLAKFDIYPFHPSSVSLNKGAYQDMRNEEIDRLIKINPDQLISYFETYDSQNWKKGYELGPYLSACAKMYATTQDPRLYDRIDHVITKLIEIQTEGRSGFLGCVPEWKTKFETLSQQSILNVSESTLDGMNRPWYYTEVLMTGLIESYIYGSNNKALKVATDIADWINSVCQSLSNEQKEQMLLCDHGRISETIANISSLTGKKKYRFLAFLFESSEIDTYQGEVLNLKEKDQYAEISKVMGYAKLYELLAMEKEYEYVTSFWNQVVEDYTFPGGALTGDGHFGERGSYSSSLKKYTPQLSTAVLMARLTHRLMCWDADAKYGDYMEKVLFNQVIPYFTTAKNNPNYSLPLFPSEQYIEQSDSINSFRNMEMGYMSWVDFSGAIFYQGSNDELYVNVFIPATLQYEKKKMQVSLETSFPEESSVILRFEGAPKKFPVKVRYPSWATHGLVAKIDGVPVEIKEKPGSFITFESEWGYGSSLEIDFNIQITEESLPDDNRLTSLFYGPVLLAGYMDNDDILSSMPSLTLSQLPLASNIYPNINNGLIFKSTRLVQPKNLIFSPLYRVTNKPHSVFWEVYARHY